MSFLAAAPLVFKGVSALAGLFGKKKKATAQDAYDNTYGQNQTDYANATTNYNTSIQNQQSQQDERSRVAKASLRASLLKSIGPNIIGQEAMPALQENAVYKPIDYSGAPQRTYVPRPSSNTGSTWDAISSVTDLIAQGAISKQQADAYQKELDNYRFSLQNPGVQQLPTSRVNYYGILKRLNGGQ